MEVHLRAGAAIFNVGHYHAAHDAWEDRWLDLEAGTDDEVFLHGLIQYTAAIHHAHDGNWSGLQGLAGSAGEYLADLPADYRGIALEPIRTYLATVAVDPEHVERERAPSIQYRGDAIGLEDLDDETTGVAAVVLAEAATAYDESVLEDAVAYAQAGGSGEGEPFRALIGEFVTAADRRDLIYDRLRGHVERRRSIDDDVDGLFES